VSALDSGRDLLAAELGFRFDATMRRRLERALADAAAAAGTTEEEVVRRARRDSRVLQDLVDRVAVRETFFFREPAHFEALSRHVLPRIDGPLNVWSAACSTGQEAYSLAMLLDEHAVPDWRVVATDVATPALARTASGSYSERELRGLPEWRRERHMRRDRDRGWSVRPELRSRVTVMRHNLARDPIPVVAGSCRIVFCRNVLIYLRPRESEAMLRSAARALSADGLLFIGASESVWPLEHGLEPRRIGSSYAYAPPRRPAAPPSRRPEPATPSPTPPSRTGPPSLDELIAAGDAALSRGDTPAAVLAYRDATRVAPSSALPYALLGLALEQSGDDDSALQCFRAALDALERGDPREEERSLEGYRAEELARLLIGKLGTT
jgi:chemotaxis methyl-accepting protein methylase